jgi:hypothetical protein
MLLAITEELGSLFFSLLVFFLFLSSSKDTQHYGWPSRHRRPPTTTSDQWHGSSQWHGGTTELVSGQAQACKRSLFESRCKNRKTSHESSKFMNTSQKYTHILNSTHKLTKKFSRMVVGVPLNHGLQRWWRSTQPLAIPPHGGSGSWRTSRPRSPAVTKVGAAACHTPHGSGG